jgi:hypothetical protein
MGHAMTVTCCVTFPGSLLVSQASQEEAIMAQMILYDLSKLTVPPNSFRKLSTNSSHVTKIPDLTMWPHHLMKGLSGAKQHG